MNSNQQYPIIRNISLYTKQIHQFLNLYKNSLIQAYKNINNYSKAIPRTKQEMKKKQQIIIHKNLQSGKIHQTEHRTSNHFTSSNRALLQKNSQKQSRKLLSQQKIPSTKRSQSKNSSKQSRQMSSSIAKNQRLKKKKSDNNKGSKKSLRRHNSEEENSIVSGRVKNIYTNVQKPKKKKQKFTDRTSSQGPQQQPSITSITESIKSQGNRLEVDQLVEEVQQHEFSNLHKLKLHMLNFIFKNRIIRDEQYNRLYELLVEKFPDKEEVCRSVLFEIVSSLDN